MTIRVLPPPDVARQTLAINGRTYTAAAGSFLDVAADADAYELTANGWVFVGLSGTTAARPTVNSAPQPLQPSMRYFDTTLSKTIFWDGAVWRDPLNGNSV